MVASDTDLVHLVYSRCYCSSNTEVTVSLAAGLYCNNLHHSIDADFGRSVGCMSDKHPGHCPSLVTYQVVEVPQESSGLILDLTKAFAPKEQLCSGLSSCWS